MTILHAALSFSDYMLGKSEVLLMSDVSGTCKRSQEALAQVKKVRKSYLMGRRFIGVPRLAVI